MGMDPLHGGDARPKDGGFRWLETMLLLLAAGGLLLFLMRAETPSGPDTAESPSPTPTQARHPRPTPTRLAVVTPRFTPTPRRTGTPEATPTPETTPAPTPTSDLPLRLPNLPKPRPLTPQLKALLADAEASNYAVAWRAAADKAVEEKAFATAADAYRKEAAAYRKDAVSQHKPDDLQTAVFEEMKASRYNTSIALYAERATTADDRQRLDTRARLEPPVGCLLGAFIDRDDRTHLTMIDSQFHGDVGQFETLTGRKHASVLMYRTYGEMFPMKWAEILKSQGVIPHIAWEPTRGLSAVADDAYLQSWVDAAREYDWPLIIRFAGEMNGNWVEYSKDPAAYRKAFRLVAQAFHKGAPKVAMLWCPAAIPRENIEPYYPGDDAVDWVGVNFYSVLFEDDNPKVPADAMHPTEYLDYVYRKYSARKPIAIGEFAATHIAHVDPKPRPQFAIQKMAELYQALPALYPRVKLVDWYDCNNMEHAQAGRQLNDYSLTDDKSILAAYKTVIARDWYIDAEALQTGAAKMLAPLEDGQSIASSDALEAVVATYTPKPHLYLEVDGHLVIATARPEGRRMQLPALAAGPHQLRLLVYDDTGEFVAAVEKQIVTQ